MEEMMDGCNGGVQSLPANTMFLYDSDEADEFLFVDAAGHLQGRVCSAAQVTNLMSKNLFVDNVEPLCTMSMYCIARWFCYYAIFVKYIQVVDRQPL